MTRPINASTGAWPATFPGGFSVNTPGNTASHPHSGTLSSERSPSDTFPFSRDSSPQNFQSPHASAASELHCLQVGDVGSLSDAGPAWRHWGPVTPGSLVCDGRPVCRGLLQPQVGQGMVAFFRDQPPARGLVACLAPGQLALVMLDGQAIGLGVEDHPLQALPGLLRRRLQDFCALAETSSAGRTWGTEPPQWALGLDMGHWSGGDRTELARLAKEFRLGVQDLRQGVWVVDQLGGLHADWPTGAHFEPQPA